MLLNTSHHLEAPQRLKTGVNLSTVKKFWAHQISLNRFLVPCIFTHLVAYSRNVYRRELLSCICAGDLHITKIQLLVSRTHDLLSEASPWSDPWKAKGVTRRTRCKDALGHRAAQCPGMFKEHLLVSNTRSQEIRVSLGTEGILNGIWYNVLGVFTFTKPSKYWKWIRKLFCEGTKKNLTTGGMGSSWGGEWCRGRLEGGLWFPPGFDEFLLFSYPIKINRT